MARIIKKKEHIEVILPIGETINKDDIEEFKKVAKGGEK